MARKCVACMRGRALVMVQNRDTDTVDYVCPKCFAAILEREKGDGSPDEKNV